MRQRKNRIEWLERQLAQVAGFMEQSAEQSQASFSAQLSRSAWQQYHLELTNELARTKQRSL